MVRSHWIKLSVIGYVVCTITYNYLGTASPVWTNFFYTYEKGFAVFCLLFTYKKTKTVTDKLFINFSLTTQIGTWLFFIICSFMPELWVFHKLQIETTLILASFGTILVTWHMMRGRIES